MTFAFSRKVAIFNESKEIIDNDDTNVTLVFPGPPELIKSFDVKIYIEHPRPSDLRIMIFKSNGFGIFLFDNA